MRGFDVAALKNRPAIYLIAADILAFTPLRFVAYIGIIYILARLLPLHFGAIGKLVVSFVVFVCANSLLAAITFLIKIPLTSGLVLCMVATALLGIIVYRYHKKIVLAPLQFWEANDWLALVVAVAIGLVLMLPITRHPSMVTLAPTIMAGGDNSAHLELIKGDDFNRGYSIGNTGNTYNLPNNINTYPQGWHYNGAFLKWVIERTVSIDHSAPRILAFYYAYCLLWFISLCFLTTRLALEPIQRARPRSAATDWSKLAALLISAIGIACWILPLFASGFQPHIGALTTLLVVVVFLLEAYRQTPQKRYPYLLLAGLAAAGLSLIWLYLLPIAVAGILVCLLQTLRANQTWRLPLYFWIGGAVVALGALFQIAIQIANPLSGGGLTARGYIPDMLPMYPLIGSMLFASLYLSLRRPAKSIRLLWLFAGFAIVFALGMMVWQLQTLHELRYYYYKATFTYVVFAIILLAVIGRDVLQRALKVSPDWLLPKSLQTGTILMVFVILSSMVFASFKSSDFDMFYHNQVVGISPEQADIMASLLAADRLNGLRYAPIGSCDRGFDIRANLLAHALAWTPESYTHPTIVLTLTTNDPQLIFWQINLYLAKYAKGQDLYVVSRDQRVSHGLTAYLRQVDPSRQHFVHIINTDPDPAATAKAVCPDSLGSSTKV